jgi:hypothetical protein
MYWGLFTLLSKVDGWVRSEQNTFIVTKVKSRSDGCGQAQNKTKITPKGTRGWVLIFFWIGILLFLWIRRPCKISQLHDNPFWENEQKGGSVWLYSGSALRSNQFYKKTAFHQYVRTLSSYLLDAEYRELICIIWKVVFLKSWRSNMSLSLSKYFTAENDQG